jgi:prevent-host-death family protein
MGFMVSIAKAKAALASLIARAEAGEEITLTRHGKPVARLMPMPARKPFKFGDLVKPGEPQRHYALEDLTIPEEYWEEYERNLTASLDLKPLDEEANTVKGDSPKNK